VSLLGAVEPTREKLIVPVLIGQEAKIRALAARAQLDLSPLDLISTKRSEAAAVLVVAMATWTRAIIAGFDSSVRIFQYIESHSTSLRSTRYPSISEARPRAGSQ
jgi:hypothetical protein